MTICGFGRGGKQLDCGLFVDSVAAKEKQNAVAAFMEMREGGSVCSHLAVPTRFYYYNKKKEAAALDWCNPLMAES